MSIRYDVLTVEFVNRQTQLAVTDQTELNKFLNSPDRVVGMSKLVAYREADTHDDWSVLVD